MATISMFYRLGISPKWWTSI